MIVRYLYFAFGILITSLCSCTYEEPRDYYSITNVKQQAEGDSACFVAIEHYRSKQLAASISNWLPARPSKILRNRGLIYRVNMVSGEPDLVMEVEGGRHQWIGFEIWIEGWVDDSLVFMLSGCEKAPCAGDSGYVKEYYTVSSDRQVTKLDARPDSFNAGVKYNRYPPPKVEIAHNSRAVWSKSAGAVNGDTLLVLDNHSGQVSRR